MTHPLFKQIFIDELRSSVARDKKYDPYFDRNFKVGKEWVTQQSTIEDPGEVKLIMPSKSEDGDYENAKIIYEAYKNLTPAQAGDARLWTYLTHTRYWNYMKKRWPIELQETDKLSRYVLEHWHVNGANAITLVRHGIAGLWWGAYLTYDANRADPYELTKELFSMKDYTRTLLTSIQGRNNVFTRALLKYVLENPKVFFPYKETKIRLLAKYLNRKGGHILLPALPEAELIPIFRTHEPRLLKVIGRESLHRL